MNSRNAPGNVVSPRIVIGNHVVRSFQVELIVIIVGRPHADRGVFMLQLCRRFAGRLLFCMPTAFDNAKDDQADKNDCKQSTADDYAQNPWLNTA